MKACVEVQSKLKPSNPSSSLEPQARADVEALSTLQYAGAGGRAVCVGLNRMKSLFQPIKTWFSQFNGIERRRLFLCIICESIAPRPIVLTELPLR